MDADDHGGELGHSSTHKGEPVQFSVSLRESTKVKTAVGENVRKQILSEKSVVRHIRNLPKRQFTQKELLAEALDTEVM